MLFKTTTFDFGGVKAGQKVTFKFEVSDGIKLPFEYINWGCSCTTGTKVDHGVMLEGVLDIDKAGYINGNRIHKAITVNFKDGKCEWIVNPDSDVLAGKVNPDKMRQVLILKGYRTDIAAQG